MLRHEIDKDILKNENHRQNNLADDSDKTKEKTGPQLKVKIRFDYKGKHKPARFFWGGKNPHDVAQEAREQQVIMWRNIPIQGINVEKIDLGEIYQVYNEDIEDNISYAPLELVIKADSLEDILSFVVREEFRRIDILEPDSIMLNNKEIERFLFKINKLVQKQINQNAKEVK